MNASTTSAHAMLHLDGTPDASQPASSRPSSQHTAATSSARRARSTASHADSLRQIEAPVARSWPGSQPAHVAVLQQLPPNARALPEQPKVSRPTKGVALPHAS